MVDKLSETLSREVGDALLSNWTDESGISLSSTTLLFSLNVLEWHTVNAKDTVLALISHISSCVFLGDERS